MFKVMIVDDSIFMRNHFAELLKHKGYETIQAMNGFEAVRLYSQNNPDAVLMDITMPVKDGLQALTEIMDLDSNAKVIMLTALNQEAAISQAIRSGAKDFLAKPVPPSQLLTTLEKVLR